MTTKTHRSRSGSPARGRPRGGGRGSRTPNRPRSSSSRWSRPAPLIVVTLVALAAAALIAVAISLAGSDSGTRTSFDTQRAVAEGAALAPLPESGTDPAVGQQAPTIEGLDRDGRATVVPAAGRPTLVLFLAHWCPHCQREVPALQGWIDAGELPDDVDIVGVATGIDATRPNYPPSAWLDGEEWTPRTVADADGAAAQAYGLTSFPYWVAVDSEGKVVERRTGELDLEQVTEMMTAARDR